MTLLKRIAFIGNSLPRRCGIATFTTALQQSVAQTAPALDTRIVAMTDQGQAYDYPPVVGFEINEDKLQDYQDAADFLNAGHFEVVCLQHEFGIFGGEAGGNIVVLLSRLWMPVVTTLHTVLLEPTPVQRQVLTQITNKSAKLVVMAEKGREILRAVYDVPATKIEVIPHGIPDRGFLEPDEFKAKLGFSGRTIILTFGLISPGKGIEFAIDAMPDILKSRPDALYVVLGRTHPRLVLQHGEAYRESLMARVRELGIEEHVVFLDKFLDQAELLDFISMCDVYVTPYLSEAQMTSGTLAYSFGLGKAVVSTPYWHARELLADGRGILVPFADAKAIGREIAGLFDDDGRRQSIRKRAYLTSRSMTWERTATRYLGVFEAARRGHRLRLIARYNRSAPLRQPPAPIELKFDYFLSMCDDTGLFQHAIHSVPDRLHGYCVDDNARALLLTCALNNPGERPLPEALSATFAAFIQHAWNPDTGRFRNFMSFDRRWLEESGSEDSHGRTLWALGECARSDASRSRRRWATALFAEALPIVERFTSPRAWAFTLLGLDAIFAAGSADPALDRVRLVLADRLTAMLAAVERPDWVWFEAGLAYDNARLPQALILSGAATGITTYLDAGLRSLRWLMTIQTSPSGCFRPVGTESYGEEFTLPAAFDQQPLEAAATISACIAAWHADGDGAWRDGATRAFGWFQGDNDLATPLADPDTGSCRDGLHADRPNENRGGESVVSNLLGLAEIRLLARAGERRLTLPPRPAWKQAAATREESTRGQLDTNDVR